MRFARFAVLTLIFVAPLVGQNTDIESLAGIQFNFANPGARSLGMGGAFLGLADDASAAEANPAGLTILRRPEVSIEGKHFKTEAFLNTTGTLPNPEVTSFSSFSRAVEVGFASFVYPIKDFTVGAYFHSALQYQNNVSAFEDPVNFFLPRGGTPVSRTECERLVRTSNDPAACTEFQLFPFLSAVEMDMNTWGLSGAWKRGNFSVGAAARYHQFEEGAFSFRSDFQGNPLLLVAQGTISDTVNRDLEKVDDVTFTVGVKHTFNEFISAGGVYKQGAQFDVPIFAVDLSTNTTIDEVSANTSFHIPDIAGLGISIRPIPVMTLNVDAVYVQYSNLVDDVRAINPFVRNVKNALRADDVVEVHLGAEYFFTTKIPVAIRAGYWIDPAHSVEYRGPLTCTAAEAAPTGQSAAICSANRVTAATLFPKGEDQEHKSIGVGLSWPRFQIDAAYETSERFKVGSISMVTRF